MKDIGKKLMDIARWYSMPADHFNTIKEAVELLEQTELKSSYNSIKTELNGDAISIQALKDLGAECIAKRDENGNLIPLGSIDSLPSVSCTETTNRCDDAISRQTVRDMLKDINADTDGVGFYYEHYDEYIKNLPSVSTEKTGQWIKRENEFGLFECSVCKGGYIGQPTCMGKPMFKYCPNCGAKMEVAE